MSIKYFRYTFRRNQEVKICGGLFNGHTGVIIKKQKLTNIEGKTVDYEYSVNVKELPFQVIIRHANLKPVYEEFQEDSRDVSNGGV